MNANLTQTKQESKPLDVFEQMAELNRPRQETKSLEPMARMMEGAMGKLFEMKLSYYIREADLEDEIINITYCLKGDERLPQDEIYWHEEAIELNNLRDFVESSAMLDVVKDYIDADGPQQESFYMPFEQYIEDTDNLKHVVAQYLREGLALIN